MATVLVVDDDSQIRVSLEAALAAEGYAVTTAPNGQAALAVLADGGVDLILSDVMMPEMDGMALLRLLRFRGDATPVVLMSAAGVPEQAWDHTHFLAKPFELDELLTTVGRAIAGR